MVSRSREIEDVPRISSASRAASRALAPLVPLPAHRPGRLRQRWWYCTLDLVVIMMMRRRKKMMMRRSWRRRWHTWPHFSARAAIEHPPWSWWSRCWSWPWWCWKGRGGCKWIFDDCTLVLIPGHCSRRLQHPLLQKQKTLWLHGHKRFKISYFQVLVQKQIQSLITHIQLFLECIFYSHAISSWCEEW